MCGLTGVLDRRFSRPRLEQAWQPDRPKGRAAGLQTHRLTVRLSEVHTMDDLYVASSLNGLESRWW